MNFLNTVNMKTIEYALDGTLKRHEAISNNIANVNTPGYKREYVDFETTLQNKVELCLDTEKTNVKHLSLQETNSLKIQKEEDYYTRKDENNINIDRENADMAMNSIMYNALIKQLSGQLNRIKTAVRDGR